MRTPKPAPNLNAAIAVIFRQDLSRPCSTTRRSLPKNSRHGNAQSVRGCSWRHQRVIPETIGGSADLTGSNNTKTAQTNPVTPDDFSGRYIHYGIREHGMAAAMNGMALHGGLIPYSGGFLIFSDYCRPSIRLAALMNQRVIHVMTHDSIGLGEDGPTHQPVEHFAALRAIPNLNVLPSR
jgi:transketolase